MRKVPSIHEINENMKKFSEEFSHAIESRNYDKAISIGLDTLRDLLKAVRTHILEALSNPEIKSIAEEIIDQHEKTLSYVEGSIEALKFVSPIYAPGEKERLTGLLSASINELFSFLMGSLIVIADALSTTDRRRGGNKVIPGVV